MAHLIGFLVECRLRKYPGVFNLHTFSSIMVAYFSVALVVIIYHTNLSFFINRHWLFWYYFSSLVNIVINNALVFSHWAIGRITMQRGRQNVTFFSPPPPQDSAETASLYSVQFSFDVVSPAQYGRAGGWNYLWRLFSVSVPFTTQLFQGVRQHRSLQTRQNSKEVSSTPLTFLQRPRCTLIYNMHRIQLSLLVEIHKFCVASSSLTFWPFEHWNFSHCAYTTTRRRCVMYDAP